MYYINDWKESLRWNCIANIENERWIRKEEKKEQTHDKWMHSFDVALCGQCLLHHQHNAFSVNHDSMSASECVLICVCIHFDFYVWWKNVYDILIFFSSSAVRFWVPVSQYVYTSIILVYIHMIELEMGETNGIIYRYR